MSTQNQMDVPQLLEAHESYQISSASKLTDVLTAVAKFREAVSLIQTAVGEIDTKKEDAKKEIQDLFGGLGLGIGGEEGKGGFNFMALLMGGDKEGLAGKGGLGALAGLLGGLNGEGENPLEGILASTYEKYLNGKGERERRCHKAPVFKNLLTYAMLGRRILRARVETIKRSVFLDKRCDAQQRPTLLVFTCPKNSFVYSEYNILKPDE